ncbi:hypothetical protein L0E83_01095 [Marichromatium gracile]|uniref:trypco2 family protein n=1 Tax=Marichromatium gracile TaxID=1048 RepID=UPI001F48FDAE|nr:trypco2 family protein [Marichromatium gracile]MCF1182031.1 hypothetical protein [Marichromatium gracile]
MSEIPLSKTLACLRQELRAAQQEAEQSGDVWFLVEELELELQVVVSQQGDGKVGFSLLGFEAGGGGGASKETVQKIRLKLGPRGADKEKRLFTSGEGEM